MSNSEWKTDIRDGCRTKIIRAGNCIVTVHRPLLSDAERKVREEQAKTAMQNLIDEAERQKKEQEEINYGTYQHRDAG